MTVKYFKQVTHHLARPQEITKAEAITLLEKRYQDPVVILASSSEENPGEAKDCLVWIEVEK